MASHGHGAEAAVVQEDPAVVVSSLGWFTNYSLNLGTETRNEHTLFDPTWECLLDHASKCTQREKINQTKQKVGDLVPDIRTA